MNYILTTFRLTDTININGYYKLNEFQYEQVMSWYNNFTTEYIDNNIVLTEDNFDIICVDYDENCEKFIEKYGNPCNILEHIDVLNDVFSKQSYTIINPDCNSDDSDLYTDTENVTILIDAHVNGRREEVETLLSNRDFDSNDDIIKKIKNNR